MRNRTDEALGLLLGHSQPDVLLAITGVFVNLSADAECKSLLLKPTANTLQIYAELLRRVSFKDIHLATLICQVCRATAATVTGHHSFNANFIFNHLNYFTHSMRTSSSIIPTISLLTFLSSRSSRIGDTQLGLLELIPEGRQLVGSSEERRHLLLVGLHIRHSARAVGLCFGP